MSSTSTATDNDGIVHQLDGNVTLCGRDATGWSRTVTQLQAAGLVIFCEACRTAVLTADEAAS
jgi:hypothetical protein